MTSFLPGKKEEFVQLQAADLYAYLLREFLLWRHFSSPDKYAEYGKTLAEGFQLFRYWDDARLRKYEADVMSGVPPEYWRAIPNKRDEPPRHSE
jgi:hypothetical protein